MKETRFTDEQMVTILREADEVALAQLPSGKEEVPWEKMAAVLVAQVVLAQAGAGRALCKLARIELERQSRGLRRRGPPVWV